MRLAVIADVHGNSPALETVLGILPGAALTGLPFLHPPNSC
jgi:hypothetical protein